MLLLLLSSLQTCWCGWAIGAPSNSTATDTWLKAVHLLTSRAGGEWAEKMLTEVFQQLQELKRRSEGWRGLILLAAMRCDASV